MDFIVTGGGTPEGPLACQNLIPNQESSREEEFVLKKSSPVNQETEIS